MFLLDSSLGMIQTYKRQTLLWSRRESCNYFPSSQISKLESSRSVYKIYPSLHFMFLVKPALEHGAPTSQTAPHLAGGTSLGIRASSSSSSPDPHVLCDLGHQLLSVPHFLHLYNRHKVFTHFACLFGLGVHETGHMEGPWMIMMSSIGQGGPGSVFGER